MKKSEQVVKYSVLEMALHEYPLLKKNRFMNQSV